MLASAKQHYAVAKQFVMDNQVLTAVVTTAVISVVVTRRLDTEAMKKFIYAAGRDYGELETHVRLTSLQNNILLGYINDNGLADNAREYIKSLGHEQDIAPIVTHLK